MTYNSVQKWAKHLTEFSQIRKLDYLINVSTGVQNNHEYRLRLQTDSIRTHKMDNIKKSENSGWQEGAFQWEFLYDTGSLWVQTGIATQKSNFSLTCRAEQPDTSGSAIPLLRGTSLQAMFAQAHEKRRSMFKSASFTVAKIWKTLMAVFNRNNQ